jgi:hypothetical protein
MVTGGRAHPGRNPTMHTQPYPRNRRSRNGIPLRSMLCLSKRADTDRTRPRARLTQPADLGPIRNTATQP